MDVVLLKDVEKLGAQGAVVHVKPGYARNYLMPRGWAVAASPRRLAELDAIKRQRLQQVQRAQAEAEALKRTLEGRSLTLKLNLGADGKSFGAITTHDLVDALRQDGLVVEKHAVHLEEPIKTLGVFEIPIKLHPEVTATLKLWVVKA